VEIADYVSSELLTLLQQYYSILNPQVRLEFVLSLKVMRSKEVVSAALVLPVFLKLFKCKDKELRKSLH
jgi:hypothetical protein